ncbi:hypothetical protein QTO34_019451 [Cnephaeus nilssonii]|uniref:Uncharacterized protein n=1 Tax=Cnephaeus nilssonii TaxID=3371016 RepID=A0AA40LNZ9_CNENI|nr:hypothetical protein QTO34_019451 [Eptesicus nilssonii]
MCRQAKVWRFQKKQTDLLIAFYKHRITKLEAAMQEAQQTVASQNKELSVLRKENEELKKFLAILKESPSWYQGSRPTTPRPVGITSPTQSVTPRPSCQHSSQVVSRSSSVESIPYRVAGFSSSVGQIQRNSKEYGSQEIKVRLLTDVYYLSIREPEAFREGALPETLILKPLHQLPLTAYHTGQRESRSALESLPGFQLPALQVSHD